MRLTEVLHVQDLCIRRGKTKILDSIEWRVQSGEHWVILGANGSGKTSLLSALTGYLTPTSGGMTVFGEVYGETDWRSLRSHIGLVSSSIRQLMPEHEPALISVASGRYAMIDFWGEPNRRDRKAAQSILRRIDCAHLADRPWLYLSQGERQRVLIGRALMAQPKVLILDEPCAGLDPAARESFLGFLDQLGRQPGGPNLILVTHHVEEITPAFTHALVLREGRISAQGPIPEVVTSAQLSSAFGAQALVRRVQGRYTLRIQSSSRW
jgi:iron complex transport system ATP-binding protein